MGFRVVLEIHVLRVAGDDLTTCLLATCLLENKNKNQERRKVIFNLEYPDVIQAAPR